MALLCRIARRHLHRQELYDLRTDRDEQVNVAAPHPEVCKRLRQRLAARAEGDRRYRTLPALL
ncbi:MAG: hypothetical protein ABW298_04820 [Candidatus Binatia bacterium]